MQVSISFHLSDEDRKRIDLLAARDGIARTKWIKDQIRHGLIREYLYLSRHDMEIREHEKQPVS